MFAAEQLHPAADRLRHAQALASQHNGPVTRSDKQPWATAQFMVPDPWAAPKVVAPQTPAELKAQVDRINAGLG